MSFLKTYWKNSDFAEFKALFYVQEMSNMYIMSRIWLMAKLWYLEYICGFDKFI